MIFLKQYDHSAHFEPLLPSAMPMTRLATRARPVVEAALRLQGALTPDTRSELRQLVRAMNSHYSNAIEGQSTHPLSIEKALRQDFSDKPEIAKRQRIALAHIEAEKALEALALSEVDAFKSDTLRTAHEFLYQRLAAEDRQSDDGQEVVPGRWREVQVAVHRHEPPPAAAMALFLARTDSVYGSGHGWRRC